MGVDPGFAGVGFVFSSDDPYTGIDLDKCRNPETGQIEESAQGIIEQLDSYTEASQSGTGVHIIVRGWLPQGNGARRRTGGIEMYDAGRFFVMTGQVLDGRLGITERQDQLQTFYRKVFDREETRALPIRKFFDIARDVLLDATRRQPQSARAWYNLGIVYRTLAQTDAAIDAFEKVGGLDASDADTLYFLGQLHAQARRYDQAIAAFEKCLALDSLHLSAEFGLARAYQLSGNDAAAAQHLARFDQLTQSKIGKQISLTYGEQGPYSTAEPVGGAEVAPRDFAIRFAASTLSGGRIAPRPPPGPRDRFLQLAGAGACFIDFDGDGRQDLLLPAEQGPRVATLYRNNGGGRFSDATAQAGLDSAGEAHGCAIGDSVRQPQNNIVAAVVVVIANRALPQRS